MSSVYLVWISFSSNFFKVVYIGLALLLAVGHHNIILISNLSPSLLYIGYSSKFFNTILAFNKKNIFKGDFLRNNNVWEKIGKDVSNYNGSLPTLDFENIQHIFNIDKLNFKNREHKKTMPKPKVSSQPSEPMQTQGNDGTSPQPIERMENETKANEIEKLI